MAEFPGSSQPFTRGKSGQAGGVVRRTWTLDGESGTEVVDLCPECAEDLVEALRNGKVAQLLRLA